ncbi:MAG: hypothetical protein V3R89_06915 [Thermoanaerobaculia bacterium]
MHRSIQRTDVLPRLPLQALYPVLSVLAFGWLLAQDLIQPIVIYLLQVYLTF